MEILKYRKGCQFIPTYCIYVFVPYNLNKIRCASSRYQCIVRDSGVCQCPASTFSSLKNQPPPCIVPSIIPRIVRDSGVCQCLQPHSLPSINSTKERIHIVLSLGYASSRRKAQESTRHNKAGEREREREREREEELAS